jgi:DNA-3-methyladenine glycosylase I
MGAGTLAKGYCAHAPGHEWHGPYHDSEYGFPVKDDAALFERLILEINQAGLSWLTVLKKRAAFQAAFKGFDPETVASFGKRDVARLMNDAGIIRNRLKIESTIDNAKRVVALSEDHGSFHAWIAAQHPRDEEEWIKLFRGTFRFMGKEIVREFLMSTGHMPGAHRADCPVYRKIARLGPPWMKLTRRSRT